MQLISIQNISQPLISSSLSSPKVTHLPEEAGKIALENVQESKMAAVTWWPNISVTPGTRQR